MDPKTEGAAPAAIPDADTTADQDIDNDAALADGEGNEDLTEEERAERAAKAEEDKKRQVNERTHRRREQRRRAEERRQADERLRLEREAAYYRGLAEGQTRAGAAQADEDPKPRREDFLSDDDWADARDDWRERQAAKKKQAKPADPATQDPRQPAPSTAAHPAAIDPEVQAGRDRWLGQGDAEFGEDFQDMLEAAGRNEFPVTTTMAEATYDLANGAAVAMHLYDNPEEATRIAQLPLYKQVKEINRIGRELNGGQAPKTPAPAADTPPQRNISRAPAPVTPEKPGDAPRQKPLSQLGTSPEDTAEYIKRRRKQLYG